MLDDNNTPSQYPHRRGVGDELEGEAHVIPARRHKQRVAPRLWVEEGAGMYDVLLYHYLVWRGGDGCGG